MTKSDRSTLLISSAHNLMTYALCVSVKCGEVYEIGQLRKFLEGFLQMNMLEKAKRGNKYINMRRLLLIDQGDIICFILAPKKARGRGPQISAADTIKIFSESMESYVN